MTFQIKKIEDLLKGHINGSIISQTLTRLTAPGENYGSLILKADIKVKNGEKEETIHAVAKCVPPNENIRKIFNIEITFKNEINWYTTVIPTVLQFQREQGVKDAADFFMKIYGARYSLDPRMEEIDDDGVILCENLVKTGYKNADRTVGFNMEQSKQILKKLAAFHALFLGLRIKKRNVFDEKVKKYLHILDSRQGRERLFGPIVEFLKEKPETSSLVHRIEKANKLLGTEGKNVREPWASAVHADFWVNNIMIKEEEGKPAKVIILDLQICALGSPVDDLQFFLGTSVDTSLSDEQFNELVKIYYTELIENLKSLKVDTSPFSFESFQKELELQGPIQYAHCMFFIPVILSEKGSSADPTDMGFDAEKEIKKMFSTFTDKKKEKIIFLTKKFADRNWI